MNRLRFIPPRSRRLLPLLVASVLGMIAPKLGAKPPAWLTEVAAQTASTDYGEADHVVLLDEATLTVEKTGMVTRRQRYALRVLTQDGRYAALARVNYDTGADKVKSFAAWLIPADGKPVDYGKRDIVDIARYGNARELYSESRQMMISASRVATRGTVFGFEAVTTEESVFAQEIWYFQQEQPVELSAITVVLPPGWAVDAKIFNRPAIAPTVTGNAHRWELRSLPGLKDEPLSPPDHARLPWLALELQPPADARVIQRIATSSWTSLSSYFTPAYETASTADAALKAKAEALTASAVDLTARVKALCRFAQTVNYVSIVLNSKEAGGMLPRSAARVLQTNYGDCKDKTTLLRALLRARGIESYPLIVHSGDPTHVRPEWVSPLQFNHCIVAIVVDDSVSGPAIVTHPKLGRLLLFDPTDEHTPAGWFPLSNAGGWGLVLAGDRGELLPLPPAKPAENRIERVVTARLEPSGAIRGAVTESLFGNSSARLRAERAAASDSGFRTETIEPWLTRSIAGASAERVAFADTFEHAMAKLEVEFAAPVYGKAMRDTLLVFKPTIVARRDNVTLKRGARTQPIVIRPAIFSERAEIELPPGFAVDESFPPVDVSAPFGKYQAKAELRDGKVIFTRALALESATLPATDYELARRFFEQVLDAEQTPIVLKKI